jgi:hypothetical protein
MDVLDRLYRKLAEAVRAERPDGDPTLTIAEAYQSLIPYRAVRSSLGLLELAEYEHALLRLLSGERGYVQVEVPRVQEELRRELEGPNPILGIYRDYAAVGLRLNPHAPSAAEPVPPPAQAPAPQPAAPKPKAGPPSVPAPSPPMVPHTRASAPEACRSCRASLPDGREVRFCPQCGAGQQTMPCRACGTPLEPEWRFCVLCGHSRRG